MKKNDNNCFKRILHFCLITLAAVFVSCENELDINNDPNNPTEVPIATLLSGAEVNLAYTLGGDATRMPATIVQHYSGHRGQPLDYGQYNITSSDTNGLWTSVYDVLNDLRLIEDQSRISNDKIYLGISQVLQAHIFSVTTDLFGDIPYTESLKGLENIAPSYDEQETIYPALITLLDEGIQNLKSDTGVNPADADLIYKGDIVKWEAFANSLKLRLYNHLSKRDPTQALAFLQTNPALIVSNRDPNESTNNAQINFGTVASNANPIYQFDALSGRRDQAVCSTIVENMKSLNDPRVEKFFLPIQNPNSPFFGEIRGNLPGQSIDDAGRSLYSRVGPSYASIDSPVIFMSSAEVEFIKAEVYFRANDFVNSKVAYDKAISDDFYDLEAADVAAYIANPLVAYDNSLERIMTQKWITMYQSSYESFVDWRRTGFPALTIPITNRTNGVTPRRLPYPQIEINVNGSSLQAGPGIPIPFVTLTTKVWWDM